MAVLRFNYSGKVLHKKQRLIYHTFYPSFKSISGTKAKFYWCLYTSDYRASQPKLWYISLHLASFEQLLAYVSGWANSDNCLNRWFFISVFQYLHLLQCIPNICWIVSRDSSSFIFYPLHRSCSERATHSDTIMLSIICRFYFGCNYFHINQVSRRIICVIHLSNPYNNYAKYKSLRSIYCEWLVSWVYLVCHVDNCNHMASVPTCLIGLYFLWN